MVLDHIFFAFIIYLVYNKNVRRDDSMILKKPYGFLIKRFRVIHIVLTLLTIYIALTSRSVLSFIRRFISNGYQVTVVDNMASEYINWTIYLTIFLVVISLIAIYVLLKSKKKPNKVYMAGIIYYIILFIGLIIASGLINGLSDSLWSTAAARTYRDIAQIIYYPQFFFIIVLGIRALGFNVKQFDFKSDLKDLEITEADSEDVELNINFKTYKAERFIRRFIREFYYYYLENKLIVRVIFVILIAVTIFLAFKSYEKIRYTYDVGESFTYNGFRIRVEDSMLTNVDSSGDAIVEGRYYLVLKLNITNNNLDNTNLDYNSLKIYINDTYVNPSLDIGNHFLDFGNPYMNRTMAAGESGTYIMAYMLSEEQVANRYRLSIYTGASQNSRSFLAITINVNLSPSRLFDVDVVREANLNETVSLSSTYLGNSTINITNADIARRYEYTYENCFQGNCQNLTGLVTASPNAQTNQILLILDYDLVLDEETDAYQNINNITTFSNEFMSLEYIIGDVTYETTLTNVTPSRISDLLILRTTSDIATADEVNLLITIRNRCYKINLV